jgi:hypothetical protein
LVEVGQGITVSQAVTQVRHPLDNLVPKARSHLTVTGSNSCCKKIEAKAVLE